MLSLKRTLQHSSAFSGQSCGCLPELDAHRCRLRFTGHYIVVLAYSADTDCYVIRDPAANEEHITIAAPVFEAARRSFGTDEDIILVRTLP